MGQEWLDDHAYELEHGLPTPLDWVFDDDKQKKEINIMQFKKAIKSKQKLRLVIDGVSGSGKTYTALAIASGIGGKIAVIDTEHGSADLYADRFEFDSLSLKSFEIEDYCDAIEAAGQAGYEVLIIDSTSHGWDALVARVENIARQPKYNNNTFRAWGEGTPLQLKLIEKMLQFNGHIIVTVRSKTEYSVDKNDDTGKTTISRVGTKAKQREGFEYEFTLAMTMDIKHFGNITKDRTGKFQDQFIEKPGKTFGQDLVEWLNIGAEPQPEVSAKEKVEQASKKGTEELKEVWQGLTQNERNELGQEFLDEQKEIAKGVN
jgi:hypothetical protein